MNWLIVLALVTEALGTSVIPVGLGSLHARRAKRTAGRRANGVCKPRPLQLTTSTSIANVPTTLPGSSSLAQPAPSASPTSVPASQGLAAQVLPLGFGSSSNSWTTVPVSSAGYYVLADTDTTLRPTRVLGGSLAAVGAAPDGKSAMEVFFGRGSYAFNSGVPGGISFYAYGPSDLSTGNEFTLGYSIYFEFGFDFVHGGKLPGLYGGTSDDEAVGCSGGRISPTCGAPIPGSNTCGADYGTSLGRGSFYFKTGQWNTVAQRIKLNTPGKADGELQVWSNGKSIWSVGGVIFRGAGLDASRVRGLMIQSFFGGHSLYWASSKDQRLWFADFSVAQLG
ncbi:Polysaccharide lyase family 14 protein [Ceratobasidium theobromae]|uniref:Polysaccharide lyase family 14 protein n=1 Tax=Ceratobasidium theobromae TaxID=1582974 RepID=A0A5N5QKE2_9AGAM|nr:Polysaccharide lyase family 14 protein [Ceratobasidium theobromae]